MAGLKGSYENTAQPAGTVDLQDMQPGEIAVQLETFTERVGKIESIDLGGKIVYAGAEEGPNADSVGKDIVHSIMFGEFSAITVRQLKDMFRKVGADVAGWKSEKAGGRPPYTLGLPGALKLLVWKQAYVIIKIDRRKDKNNVERNYGALLKICDTDPETSEPLPPEHVIPVPLPNELIIEAINADVPSAGKGVTDAKSVI